jgi:hypothetical protein
VFVIILAHNGDQVIFFDVYVLLGDDFVLGRGTDDRGFVLGIFTTNCSFAL